LDSILPAVTAALLEGNVLGVTLPAPTMEASGDPGLVGTLAGTSPAVLISGSLIASGEATLARTLPAFLMTASATVGVIGSIAVTLSPVLVSASAVNGVSGTIVVDLPAVTPELSSYGPYTGTIEVTLPHVRVEAQAFIALAAAFRTWVLNTRKKALTEYDNFNFNSYARFNGVTLAASSAGIFKLAAEDTDAGTEIDAVVRTGQQMFGTTFNKRVPRIYAGYEATGPLRFVTITSQDGRRTYQLPDNRIRGVQQRRVPVGRGPKSPYWQFEVQNEEGSDFLIEHLDLYPEVLSRRVL